MTSPGRAESNSAASPVIATLMIAVSIALV
jgi:hypothetical protein